MKRGILLTVPHAKCLDAGNTQHLCDSGAVPFARALRRALEATHRVFYLEGDINRSECDLNRASCGPSQSSFKRTLKSELEGGTYGMTLDIHSFPTEAQYQYFDLYFIVNVADHDGVALSHKLAQRLHDEIPGIIVGLFWGDQTNDITAMALANRVPATLIEINEGLSQSVVNRVAGVIASALV
jgi:hypothetical protein